MTDRVEGVTRRGFDEVMLAELEAEAATPAQLPAALELWRDLVSQSVTDADIQELTERALGVLEATLEQSDGAAIRGALLERRAAFLQQLGDARGADIARIEAYETLPTEEVLARLAEDTPLSEDSQAALLDLRIRLATEPSRRADAARQLAGLRMADGDTTAAEFLYQQVLEVDPDDAIANEAIESIAAQREARANLHDALTAEVEAADDAATRSAALLSLGQFLLEEDPESREGSKALEKAAEVDPANSEAAMTLMEWLTAQRKWAPARRVGEAWLEAVAENERSAALRFCGLALLEGTRHRDFVVECLTPVVADAPADAEVVDALDVAMSAQNQWEALVEVFQAARRATRDRALDRRWLVREAEITWRHLDDLESAEKMFRRVRAADPRDMTALEFFEDQLTRAEDWKRLHAVLSQKYALVPSERRVTVAVQMAELAEHKMESLDKAIEAYKRVLSEEPGNAEAVEKLAELYRKTGKWHALIDFLNSQIRKLGAGVEATEQKVALLFRIIDIYQDAEKLPVEEMVIHTYNRVVQLSPTNGTALDNLAQRYEDAHRWSELVGVLQKKIEATTDEDQLLDLFHQVADLYLSKMSSESQAVPFLERILEVDPSNLDVVRKLRSIYKAKHNLERLYATYMAELRLLEGPDREPVLTELAALATDKLYWNSEAIGHWEELVALSPRSEKAVNSLMVLYAQEGRWEHYVGLLDSRLELARTKRKRVEILEKIGQIRHEKLGQDDAARAVYREILELQPGHRAATSSLQKLYLAAQDWDELKALYASGGDWAGYIAFLEETREREDDPVLATEILMEIVRIHETHLDEPAAAVTRLEELLAQDPADARVATLLETRYAALGRLDDRLRMLEIIAENSLDVDERLRVLEAGRQDLAAADRQAEAFDFARRAADLMIDEARDIEAVVERLERMAEDGGRLTDFATWLGDAATRVGATHDRLALLRRQAWLLKDRLRNVDAAIDVFEELSQLDDNDWDSLAALESLTYGVQDWDGFERALRRQVAFLEREGDDDRFRRVALRLGELHAEILDDPDQAVDAYRRILDRLPGDEEAVDALNALFTAEQRWDDLRSLLQGELARAGDPALQVELEVRLARLHVERLDDPDTAVDRAEAALEKDGTNAGAIDVLWQIFESGDVAHRVDPLLEPLLREGEQYERLAVVLTARLDRVGDDERALLLADIAQLEEGPLDQPEAAFERRLALVALTPGDADARERLEHLAEVTGRWAEVAELYGELTGLFDAEAPSVLNLDVRPPDGEASTAIARRLGNIYEVSLHYPERAIACYERVLSTDEPDLELLGALERLHAELEDWPSLLAVYRQKSDLVWEADDKKAVYLDMCRLLRDELDRPEEAIEYYRNALAIDDTSLEIIAELEGLYAEFQRWHDLVELLQARLSLVEGTEARVDVLFELAALYRDQLEDVDRAIETFVSILGEDDGHEPTIAALEALVARDDLPGFEEFAPRIADIVQPWLDARGEWRREIEVLRVRARLAVTDAERAGYLRRIGSLWEDRGGELQEAFSAYGEAVGLEPGNLGGREALERIARPLECWSEWVAVLEDATPPGDPAVAIPLQLTIGGLARQELADLERAADAYERVLSYEPMHAEALAALDGIYAETGQPSERVSVVERLAEVADDESTRRNLRYEAAQMHRDLGQEREAIDAYAWVVEHGDPRHEPQVADALDALVTLYREGESWLQLCQALEKQAEFAPDDARCKEWLYQAAEVQETRLDNPDEAVRLYERVRDIDPSSKTAFTNLRRLFGSLGRWDDLEQLLLDARTHADGPQANIYDFMLGQLYDNELGRRGDAIDRYEAILDREVGFKAAVAALHAAADDPEFGLRATDVLVRTHRTVEEWLPLYEVLEHRLEMWPGDIDVVATRAELARLAEHQLGDKQAAFEHLRRATLAGQGAPHLRTELVRLARETDGFEELEVTDREVLDLITDADARIGILLEMARVAQDEREQMDVAEAILKEILEEAPGHTPTLETLRELYEQTDRAEDMVEILRLQADYTDDAEEQLATLYMIAAIQKDQLDDPVASVDTYEQILARDPAQTEAYRRLELIFAELDDHEGVITVLERELATQQGDAAIANRERITGLLLDAIEDRFRALQEAELLLDLDPNNATGTRVLEVCWSERFDADRVLGRLAPIYEAAERWDDLIALYREVVDEGELDAQVSGLTRILDIQRLHTNDQRGVFETLMALVQRLPDERRRWDDLEKAASRVDATGELADFFEALVDDAASPVVLALRAAALREGPAEDLDGAIRLYLRVLELEPTEQTAREALSRVYQEHERYRELVALRHHEAEHAGDDKARRRVLFDAARIQEELLDDRSGAAESLFRVLDNDPGSRKALGRLETLLTEEGRHDDLEDLYLRWLTVVEGDEANTIRFRLARFQLETREDIAAALETLGQITREAPQHAESVALLESILAEPPGPESEHEAVRVTVAELLERGYDQSTPWTKWEAIVRAQLDGAREAETRMLLHNQLGTLYLERAEAPADAFEQYGAAFDLQYGNHELRETLERLASEHAMWAPLVDVYERGLDDAPSDIVRAEILARLGELYLDELGDRDAAARHYESLLELEPEHPGALAMLEGYYRDGDGPDDLARVLQLRLAATGEAADRVTLLYQLADLYFGALSEQAGSVAAGIEALRDVLSLDASQRPAKERLEALHKAREEWDELVEVYRWKLEYAEGNEDRIDILTDIANVRERHLDSPEDTVQTFEEILELSPQNVYAITSLERLYPELEDWEGMLRVLTRKRELFRSPRDKVSVDFQMGALLYDQLAQPERALEQLRLVLVHEPEHAEAIAYLETMLDEPAVRLPISFLLEPIYSAAGSFDKLVGLIEIQLDGADEPEERIELLRRLAELRLHELDDVDGAMGALGDAFLLDPTDDETREGLLLTAEAGDAWAKLADIYQQALGHGVDLEMTRRINTWLAELAEQQLSDPEEAIDRYRDVLAYDEFNVDALRALSRLLESTQRWDELCDVLRREMTSAPPERVDAIKRRLAQVQLEHLDNPEAALELFKELIFADASDEEGLAGLLQIAEHHPLLRDDVLRVLLPIHQSAERWEEVVSLRLMALDDETPDSVRATTHKKVAEVYENHLDNPEEAYRHYRKALDADPGRDDVLGRMERLARNAERFDDLLDVYEALADHSDLPEQQAAYLVKAAHLAQAELDQVELAETLYRKVLSVDEANLDALTQLEALYESQGKVLELIEICEAKVLLPISVREQVELFRKIARAATVRQDLDTAADAWRRLVDVDARDAEALRALEALYRGAEDFERLAWVVERRAAGVEDHDELVRLKVDLGRLRRDRIGDPAAATEAYEEALELDEANLSALTALTDLYDELGRYRDLADVLETRLQLAAGGETLALRRRLARIEEEQLENVDAAARHYEGIIADDPTDEATLDELIRIYHHHERYDALCLAYERKVALIRDPLAQTALKVRAAEIYEEQLGNADRASELAAEVLEVDADNRGALMMQARLLVSRGDPDGAIAAYEALMPQLETARERVRGQLNLGRLYLERDNTSRALACFRDVLAADPNHAEAAKLLKDVLYKRESWEALVPVLERDYARAKEARDKAEIAREIARLLRETMGQPDEAYRWLREAYGVRRDHAGVVSDLIDYYESVGRQADGIPLLAWLVSYLEAKRRYPELAVQAFRLGRLYEQTDEPDRALSTYQVAAQADSRHIPSLLALGRLYYAAERPDKALQTLQGLLMLQHEIDDDETRAALFAYLARACIATGDTNKARRHVTRLKALAPDHPDLADIEKAL